MAQRMVKLQNMVNKTVGVKNPDYNINREWRRKGQIQSIPFETVEQLLWTDGFRRMLTKGILYINDMQDKIDLGLEPEGAKAPENIIILNDGQIKTLLLIRTFEEFKEEVKTLNLTQIRNIVNYAIENEIADVSKSDYLKEITNIDILKSISLKKELEKEDQKEAK